MVLSRETVLALKKTFAQLGLTHEQQTALAPLLPDIIPKPQLLRRDLKPGECFRATIPGLPEKRYKVIADGYYPVGSYPTLNVQGHVVYFLPTIPVERIDRLDP